MVCSTHSFVPICTPVVTSVFTVHGLVPRPSSLGKGKEGLAKSYHNVMTIVVNLPHALHPERLV